MLTKMLSCAQYELLNFPHAGIGNRLFPGSKNRMGYANSCLAKAMMDYYKKHVNSEEAREIMEVVQRYYSRWFVGGKKIRSLEEVYMGMALIDLHQITGNDKYKKAADHIFDYVMNHAMDETGSLLGDTKSDTRNIANSATSGASAGIRNGNTPGNPNSNNYVYAETIGMVCPFLAKYGRIYENAGAYNLAVAQIQNFVQFGLDEKLVLPYHAYDSQSRMKMGIIGWGQAVGKLMMGMSETLYYMETDKPGYETVKQAYRRLVDKVEAYQMEGGLYNWQLLAKEGPADTAASAMILYSVAQSLEDKVLIGIHKNRMIRGVEAIKACIQEDGTLPGASAECKGINNYPVVFDSYPWSIGPAMSLLVLLEEVPTTTPVV